MTLFINVINFCSSVELIPRHGLAKEGDKEGEEKLRIINVWGQESSKHRGNF